MLWAIMVSFFNSTAMFSSNVPKSKDFLHTLDSSLLENTTKFACFFAGIFFYSMYLSYMKIYLYMYLWLEQV